MPAHGTSLRLRPGMRLAGGEGCVSRPFVMQGNSSGREVARTAVTTHPDSHVALHMMSAIPDVRSYLSSKRECSFGTPSESAFWQDRQLAHVACRMQGQAAGCLRWHQLGNVSIPRDIYLKRRRRYDARPPYQLPFSALCHTRCSCRGTNSAIAQQCNR